VGSGKTTRRALRPAWWRCPHGRCSSMVSDVTDLALHDLRRAGGPVPQEGYLFSRLPGRQNCVTAIPAADLSGWNRLAAARNIQRAGALTARRAIRGFPGRLSDSGRRTGDHPQRRQRQRAAPLRPRPDGARRPAAGARTMPWRSVATTTAPRFLSSIHEQTRRTILDGSATSFSGRGGLLIGLLVLDDGPAWSHTGARTRSCSLNRTYRRHLGSGRRRNEQAAGGLIHTKTSRLGDQNR